MAKKADTPAPTPASTMVVVQEKVELPVAVEPMNFEQDQGMGIDFTPQDMAVPFLVILQSGSPQVKRGDQQIEGAEEGDILNTVTGQLYGPDDGVHVIPCGYQKMWVEWRPRESGGGFVKQFPDDSILIDTKKDEKGRDVLPNGNIIVTTAYHFVILLQAGGYEQAVISMASTQLKWSRRWNSLIANIKMQNKAGNYFTPPMFSHIYHLTTKPQKNEKGQWQGWVVAIEKIVDSPDMYNLAKSFSELVRNGKVITSTPPVSEDVQDADVPF